MTPSTANKIKMMRRVVELKLSNSITQTCKYTHNIHSSRRVRAYGKLVRACELSLRRFTVYMHLSACLQCCRTCSRELPTIHCVPNGKDYGEKGKQVF